MATATRARKPKGLPATSKNRKKVAEAPVAKSNGKAKTKAGTKSAGSSKFDRSQPVIAGMEDVDERIPALEEMCQRAIANNEAKASAAQDMAEDLEKIGELLKEHDLDCYIVAGKKFFIEPGEPHVKMLKVKQQ